MGTICNVVIVKLKNKKIILFSIILTLLLCTGGYELLKTFQYFSWKKSYQESGDWYQKLTIPSQNKKLMWEYRPNSKFREIETNQFGFREKKSVTLKKNSDTYRVAFVGDSLTLGLSVNAKDTFVKKYGDISNKDQKIKIEALNFSIDGYNAGQIYEMIKTKVIPFSPNKIVYVMCLNDFDFDDASGQKILYFQKPSSFLIERIKKVIKKFRIKFMNYTPDYYLQYFDLNKNKVFDYILKMKKLTEDISNSTLDDRKISFEVIIMPVLRADEENFNNYRQTSIHKELIRYLEGNRITTHDLLPLFKKENKPPRFFAIDIWHLNLIGHDFVGKKLQTLIEIESF